MPGEKEEGCFSNIDDREETRRGTGEARREGKTGEGIEGIIAGEWPSSQLVVGGRDKRPRAMTISRSAAAALAADRVDWNTW